MEKIKFEDGVLVKPAIVSIEGQEYEVNESQWRGNTPLSAFVLNKMQENIETEVNTLKTIKNYSSEVVLQNGYTHMNAFLASPQVQRIRKYGTG